MDLSHKKNFATDNCNMITNHIEINSSATSEPDIIPVMIHKKKYNGRHK